MPNTSRKRKNSDAGNEEDNRNSPHEKILRTDAGGEPDGSSNVSTSTSKRKKSMVSVFFVNSTDAIPPDLPAPVQREPRSTRGKGGQNARNDQYFEAIKKQETERAKAKGSHKPNETMLEDEPTNSMAPPSPVKRGQKVTETLIVCLG